MKSTNDSFIKELDRELNSLSEKHVSYTATAYNKECTKRKRGFTVGTVFVIVFELLFLGFLSYKVYEKKLAVRSVYELENEILGEVKRPEGVYVGDTDFGYLTGSGTFSFYSGLKYSGEWNDNNMTGIGELSNPEIGKYTGSFVNSKKDGLGTFIWNDGSVYEGEFKDDKFNGNGIYKGSNGSYFSGCFVDNKIYSGTGEFTNATGKYFLVFEDGAVKEATIEFSDGSMYTGGSDGLTLEGNGKITYPNGDCYEGEFEGGFRTGTGTYTWGTGDVYSGEWRKDEFYGQGSLKSATGVEYSGEFKDNELESGKINYSNENGVFTINVFSSTNKRATIVLNDGTTIEGNCDLFKFTETVIIKYKNGDKYEGEIKNGQREGNGKYTWSDGTYYSGDWKNDLMHGKGTYIYSLDGKKLEGEFKNGKPDGKCEYYESSTKHYTTEWSEGVCTKVVE